MERTTAILTGRVGSDIAMHQDQQGGAAFARFRLVVPRGRWNDQGTWEEQEGGWYTVKAWGNLAHNMHHSLRKGHPVVVVGRPSAQGWISKENKVASEIAINASAIGHDLARGVSTFARVLREQPPTEDLTPGQEGGDEPGSANKSEDVTAEGDAPEAKAPAASPAEDGVETATVRLVEN